VVVDVDGEGLGVEAERLRQGGAAIIEAPVDVGDPVAMDELAAEVSVRLGRLDVLCNNAGTLTYGAVWDIDLVEWERVLRVNLLSVVHGVRSFVPIMRSSGDDGQILNTASMAAFMQFGGVAPYSATKHAVVGLSISLAEDLAAAGSSIQVSVACPGVVATALTQPDGVIPPEDELPAGTLSARAAAAAIRTGMDERRFYVFTHEDSIETVRDRCGRAIRDAER
jgi:NAD(P)-dependent dehydrogenase (short-subunit alcohol dehydrogenase family)